MFIPRASAFLSGLADKESLKPDLARATRATIAFAVPLLLVPALELPLEPVFAAIAAQNIAMVDVRGAYRLRFALLIAMLLVLGGAVALGGLAVGHLAAALLATAFIALAGGLWRHVSSDYGAGLAVSSFLLFFLALAAPAGQTEHHLVSTLSGGAFGLALQMLFWPFRPQHPLRRATADTWLAASDLLESFSAEIVAPVSPSRIQTAETVLRSTLNQTDHALANAPAPLATALSNLNLFAARFTLRASALHTALQSADDAAARARIGPTLATLFDAAAQLSQNIALAIVSRQPAHVAGCEIGIRRLNDLVRTAEARLEARGRSETCLAQVAELLRKLGELTQPLAESLRAGVERSRERAAFPMELLERETWQLRPLAAAIDFSPKVDPSLVRFSLRLAVLTASGVLAFKLLQLPHGYWLPFTVVVVLQPDYGSTRARAAQRVLGTLAGGATASLILWLHPPHGVVVALILSGVFFFCYNVRRHYARAIFGVTIFVVLLMESSEEAGSLLAMERFGMTLAGGLLALGAALLFWPAWERDRLPPVLASALQANRDYLHLLAEAISSGDDTHATLVRAKRRSESANALVFASLRRLFADPKNRRDRVEQLAALANGNQRVTRLANVLLVHLRAGSADKNSARDVTFHVVEAALDALSRAVLLDDENASLARLLSPHELALDTLELSPKNHVAWIEPNLAAIAIETRGMLVAFRATRARGE